MNKVLFILKKRKIYSEEYYSSVNSGLYNSATFVNDMLVKNGYQSNLVEVDDNNDIDREVTKYRPDIVIIEALWVTPSKFEALSKLHPDVKWVIRLHSELPFIANEGIAIEWLKGYVKQKNVYICANSKTFIKSMEPILNRKIIYLPNYYPITAPVKVYKPKQNKLFHVGLFCSVRPMKNCLTQAVAAMIYADRNDKVLVLHINSARVEQKGENSLKNIRALFKGTPHILVEHDWLKHKDFVKLVAKMDICLQVSLTETYNIVTADAVNQMIPVVTSKEIPFVLSLNTVKETKDAVEIADKMELAMAFQYIFTWINKFLLRMNSSKSEQVWLKTL